MVSKTQYPFRSMSYDPRTGNPVYKGTNQAQPAPRNMAPFSKPPYASSIGPVLPPLAPWANYFNFGPGPAAVLGDRHSDDERSIRPPRVGEVRLVELFSVVTFEQRHFGSHTIVFDGLKFDKIMDRTNEHVLPSEAEITDFKKAIAKKARTHERTAYFASREPKLQFAPEECDEQ